MTYTFPWLSTLLLTPLLGAILISLAPRTLHPRLIALGATGLTLILGIALVFDFDAARAGEFQFIEKYAWISGLDVYYQLGVDGVSLLFLPFTALLFGGVILASWNSTRTMPRAYYALLLLLQTATLGVFCALDTMLFFLFWELTLVPVYFLISLWGVGPLRRYAAIQYTMLMLAGGVPLLFGLLWAAFSYAGMHGGALGFDYLALLSAPLPGEAQTLLFFLLLLGFGVKTPLFPLHTWLPTLAMEGPAAVAALMTGLKLGAYGLLRFLVPLAPEASQHYHWLLAGLGVIGVLYGAMAALSQTNLRRMLAYASISHVGLVVLAIASFNLHGFQGAVLQLLNFTVVAGGLFLLAGFLHQRIGSTDFIALGGVAQRMPLFTAFFFLFALTSIGFPGTNGFPAEFMLLLSVLQTYTGTGLAALFGVVLAAAYTLMFYRRALLGPVRNAVVADSLDLRRRELSIVLVLALCILVVGLYPALILDLLKPAGAVWVGRL